MALPETDQVKMSVGLLRVLAQSQTITPTQAEHYQAAIKAHKDIMPMLFDDGVISPKALGELVARVFSYPLLDFGSLPAQPCVNGCVD